VFILSYLFHSKKLLAIDEMLSLSELVLGFSF
jgi:hypothetical protein